MESFGHSVDINAYNFYHNHRADRVSGGVGLYLLDNIVVKIRDDITLDNNDIAEACLLKLTHPNKANDTSTIVYYNKLPYIGHFSLTTQRKLDSIVRRFCKDLR